MNQQLSEFLNQYEGESSNTISKFKKYRNAHLGGFGLSLVLTIVTVILHEVVGFRPAELPYSRVILYLLPVLALVAWFVTYLGYRDIDMSYKRVTIYEIAEAIKCYNNEDFDSVFKHVENLEDEVTYSSNNVFSEEKQQRISEYYERLDNNDSKNDVINESFVEFATILINDIADENKLAEITPIYKRILKMNFKEMCLLTQSNASILACGGH